MILQIHVVIDRLPSSPWYQFWVPNILLSLQTLAVYLQTRWDSKKNSILTDASQSKGKKLNVKHISLSLLLFFQILSIVIISFIYTAKHEYEGKWIVESTKKDTVINNEVILRYSNNSKAYFGYSDLNSNEISKQGTHFIAIKIQTLIPLQDKPQSKSKAEIYFYRNNGTSYHAQSLTQTDLDTSGSTILLHFEDNLTVKFKRDN